MAIDFSTALRQEAEQKHRSELMAQILALAAQVKLLENKIDTLLVKKSKE